MELLLRRSQPLTRDHRKECYGCMEQRDSMLSTPSIWICPQCAVKLAMASTTKVRVVIRSVVVSVDPPPITDH